MENTCNNFPPAVKDRKPIVSCENSIETINQLNKMEIGKMTQSTDMKFLSTNLASVYNKELHCWISCCYI